MLKARMLLVIAVAMCLSNGLVFAGEKVVKSLISPPGAKEWKKAEDIKWVKGGFELTKKTYAWVESKERLDYVPKGIIKMQIKELDKTTLTMQIQMFDKKNKFLGHIEPIERSDKTGEVVFKLAKFQDKIDKKTAKINFKLWIEGPVGAKVLIQKFRYK
jgi:hypothetical protein